MLNPLFENQGIRFQSEVLISKLSVLISSQFWFSITLIHFLYLKTPPSCSETVLKFWFSVTLIISFLCKHQCLVQRQFRNFDSVLHSVTHPFNFIENINGLFRDSSKIVSHCHTRPFHFFENTTGLFRESSEIVQLYISPPPSCISLFRPDASWQDNNEPPPGVSAAL